MTKTIIIMAAATIAAYAGVAAAQGRVNTAETSRVLPPPSKAEIASGQKASPIKPGAKVPEEWIPLLNPAFEEFWREGNHRPDAGFVLLARKRSVESARLWLLRMETKAKVLEEMFGLIKTAQAQLVREGLLKDRYGMVNRARHGSLPQTNTTSVEKGGLKSLEFFFLFSPTCPHCKRLAQTLQAFPNVKPLQVSGTELTHWEGLPSSDMATEETKGAYVGSGGVPVLVIHQPGTKKVVSLRGNRSAKDIMIAASTLMNHQDQKKGGAK